MAMCLSSNSPWMDSVYNGLPPQRIRKMSKRELKKLLREMKKGDKKAALIRKQWEQYHTTELNEAENFLREHEI